MTNQGPRSFCHLSKKRLACTYANCPFEHVGFVAALLIYYCDVCGLKCPTGKQSGDGGKIHAREVSFLFCDQDVLKLIEPYFETGLIPDMSHKICEQFEKACNRYCENDRKGWQ